MTEMYPSALHLFTYTAKIFCRILYIRRNFLNEKYKYPQSFISGKSVCAFGTYKYSRVRVAIDTWPGFTFYGSNCLLFPGWLDRGFALCSGMSSFLSCNIANKRHTQGENVFHCAFRQCSHPLFYMDGCLKPVWRF